MELLHIDLGGPLPSSLITALQCVSTFDDCTELSVATPLKRRADLAEAVKAFVLQLETENGLKVQRAHCDGAAEFVESTKELFRTHGTRMEITAAYAQQQNGKVERFKRTFMELELAVMSVAGLEHSVWAEALLTELLSCNRSPASGGKAAPLKLFYSSLPDVGMLGVWGSPIYALKRKKKERKMEPNVLVRRLLGYGAGGKAYSVYTPKTKNLVSLVSLFISCKTDRSLPVESVSPSAGVLRRRPLSAESLIGALQCQLRTKRVGIMYGRNARGGCQLKSVFPLRLRRQCGRCHGL